MGKTYPQVRSWKLFVKEAEGKDGRVSVVEDTAARTGRYAPRVLARSSTSSRGQDPVAHFRAEVAAENEAARAEAAPITVTLHPLQRIDKRAEGRIDMGAAVPSAYFHRELGIRDFFERRRTSRGFAYDPCRILKLLTWNRVSEPGSKAAAFASRGRFPRKCGFSLDDVYRCLDYLAANADGLVKHMNSSIEAARGPRDRTRLYYDVTNYYFEMDGEDEEGLRKKGVSKEHRPEAVVQMGLLLDAEGMPLDYELFPGNVNDMSTMLPMMREAGLRGAGSPGASASWSWPTGAQHLSSNIAACWTATGSSSRSRCAGRPGSSRSGCSTAPATESDSGRFKVKSRIADKAVHVTGEDGKRRRVVVPVKEVAFWSRDFCERARHERAKGHRESPGPP